MAIQIDQLQTVVQRNCHIADANAATNYTLCIYLLKMREFYRWENQQSYSEALPREQIGNWLREREALWESLEHAHFEHLDMGDRHLDPFETEQINQSLLPHGLIYSAGLGYGATPHFFLGHLESQDQHQDYSVLIAADELARDLTAPPAMTLGNTIVLRRQSLRRMFWERVEQWYWNRPKNPMEKVMGFYDFDHDLENALDKITSTEMHFVLLHEIGEVKAGKQLGQEWETMLADLPRSKAELMIRAVRDHIADGLSTLPELLRPEHTASIHFYFANLNNMRKDLYPALLNAYHHWCESNNLQQLREQTQLGLLHWSNLAEKILRLFNKQEGKQSLKMIETLIEQHRL